jgi:hypothetical protein
MSRFPFFFTLAVSLGLVGTALARRPAPPEASRRPASFGYPDERGVLLKLHRAPGDGACAGTRFRAKSPEFVLWDDGTVVYRTGTYEYRKGSMEAEAAWKLADEVRRETKRLEPHPCADLPGAEKEDGDTILETRDGPATVSGLYPRSGLHANLCPQCRPLRKLGRLVREMVRWERPDDSLLTGAKMEVYLEFKSCGCRDFPQIAKASVQWPLEGKPSGFVGRNSGTIVISDPAKAAALARAIERSAAVLEGDEIYTCFLRPLAE